MRSGDEHVRMVLLQDRLGAGLVVGAGVAVDEQDRAGLDPALFKLRAERRDLFGVERLLDLAVREHALVHLEPQRALDQRRVLLEEQVVGVRPVDAADLVDVAEAFGDQQRGLRAGALQDRVDRHRRAVQEQPGRAIVAAGLLDPAIDAVDQPLRRRQRLAEAQRAGLVVEHRDVGEGAADVGGEAHGRPGWRIAAAQLGGRSPHFRRFHWQGNRTACRWQAFCIKPKDLACLGYPSTPADRLEFQNREGKRSRACRRHRYRRDLHRSARL